MFPKRHLEIARDHYRVSSLSPRCDISSVGPLSWTALQTGCLPSISIFSINDAPWVISEELYRPGVCHMNVLLTRSHHGHLLWLVSLFLLGSNWHIHSVNPAAPNLFPRLVPDWQTSLVVDTSSPQSQLWPSRPSMRTKGSNLPEYIPVLGQGTKRVMCESSPVGEYMESVPRHRGLHGSWLPRLSLLSAVPSGGLSFALGSVAHPTVWRLVPCSLSLQNSTLCQKSFHILSFFLILFNILHSPNEVNIPSTRKGFSITNTDRGPMMRDAAQKTTGLTEVKLKRWVETHKSKELQLE